MTENILPFPSIKLPALRPINQSYDDVCNLIKHTYNFYSNIEKALSPYNAKQNSINSTYVIPTKQQLIDMIGPKHMSKNMPELLQSSMLNSTIRFCERWKGKRQLPFPHSSTHHSIQISDGGFLITKAENNNLSKRCRDDVYKITFENLNPIYVENFRPQQYRFLIVRQRLCRTGVPSNNMYEVLFFKNNYGFIIDWIDAELNVRWAGMI